MSLSDKLKAASARAKAMAPPKREGPLWKGPEVDGVTQSLLSRFLVCRERFHLLVVEGLRPNDGFNHRLEFGSMWHVCEEALASERSHFGETVGTSLWTDNLKEYAKGLCKKYPTSQEQIDLWYRVCKEQFPVYVEYWSKHPDVKDRTPLLQEGVFDVPYKLPSGRIVRLRGKWDSVDLIGKGKGAGVYLQENKTKSSIDERQIKRQLTYDLQTMIYLVALTQYIKEGGLKGKCPQNLILTNYVNGIRYNVIRRSLHRQGKKETREDFAKRVGDLVREAPNEWFMRWRVEVGPHDIARFRRECLDPILENLYVWWDWINIRDTNRPDGRIDPFSIDTSFDHVGVTAPHWRHPFGVYNVLDEGGSSEVDEYLSTGSEVGLSRATTLFPELEGG